MAAAGSWPVNLHWEAGKLTGGAELCHGGGINCFYSRWMSSTDAHTLMGAFVLVGGSGFGVSG